jgi:hypothetical protein
VKPCMNRGWTDRRLAGRECRPRHRGAPPRHAARCARSVDRRNSNDRPASRRAVVTADATAYADRRGRGT